MTYDIAVITARERTAMARELIAEETALAPAIGSALREGYRFVRAFGLRPLGAPFVIYRDRLEDDRWAVEVCLPIAEAPPHAAPEGLRVQLVPAGLVATTVHRGPLETVGQAYEEMARWIGENGFTLAGSPREIHVGDAIVGVGTSETIVEIPVARLTAD